MRIGLISDTHVPEGEKEMQARILEVFAGVDLILHGGDLNKRWVLDELNRIAPTLAVVGNADLFGTGLPARRVIEIGGKRIGLTHGHGNWPRYLWRKMIDLLGYNNEFYARAACAEFERDRVDAVIFGHTHRPYLSTLGGVVVFNPGPVAPDYYTTRGPQVGLLRIEPDRLGAEVIEL